MIMFKIGRYYKTYSLIHNINPFLKMFLTILFIISTLFAKSLMSILFLIAFLLIILVASNVPIKEYVASIWFARYFIILLSIMDFLFFKSFMHLLLALIPMILIILMTSVVLFTTKVRDIIMTLEIILTPLKVFKINPRKIAFMIMQAIRFIPILLDEARNIIKTMKNRNFKAKETFKDKILNAKSILNPLMQKSFNHADRLADVMIIRNYNFSKKEKYIMYTSKIDYAFAATQIILFVAILMKG